DERVVRTDGLAFGGKQTILAILVASECPRIPMFAVSFPCVMLLLSVDQLITNIDRRQFVSSHSARQDFFLARIRIEVPAAIFFYDRNRIRPVLSAHVE